MPNDASASAGGAAPTPRNSCVEPARVELPARRASPHERSPAASSSNQFGAAAADAAATAGWALPCGLRGSSSDPSSLPFTTVLGAFGARSAAYSEVQETSLGWCTAQRLRMQESYGATGDGLGAVEHDSAAPATAAADGMDDELGAPYNGEPLHSTHMQMHDRQFDDRLLRTVRARAQFGARSPCAIMPHRPAARQVPEGGESTTDGAESSGAPESSADRDTLFSMSPNFSSSRQGSRTSSCQSTSRKSAGIPSGAGDAGLGGRALAAAVLPRATARRSAAGSPRAAGSPVARDARPPGRRPLLPHPYISSTFFPFFPHALPTHLSSLHTSLVCLMSYWLHSVFTRIIEEIDFYSPGRARAVEQ